MTKTKYNLSDLDKPKAVQVLQARIARHETMNDRETEARFAAWERVKQNRVS
jgi:hypothetical protein